jgi:hypothetical protein
LNRIGSGRNKLFVFVFVFVKLVVWKFLSLNRETLFLEISVTLLEGIPDLSTYFFASSEKFLFSELTVSLFSIFFFKHTAYQLINWINFRYLSIKKISAVPDVKNWIRFSLIDFIPGDPLQRLAQVITSKEKSIWSIKDDIQNHRC